MKGIMSMYDYKWKKVGFVASGIGMAAMVAERLKGFIIFKKLDVIQHYFFFEWIMFLGLFTVIYSKEKHDDDRAKMIRMRTFQMAFLLELTAIFSIALTTAMHPEEKMGADVLFLLGGLGIFIYLIFFNVGLHFDFLWDYEDRGVWENLKNIGKNKWGIIVYLVGSAVIFLALFFLQP